MNQTLNDNNLEMKKEQRKVLDELEKQLSSLINEKEKLEERQVTTSKTKFARTRQTKEYQNRNSSL